MAERVIALPTGAQSGASLAGRRGMMMTFPQREEPAPVPRIALVGVGGAGTNILARIGDGGGTAVRRIALNTDAQALAQADVDETVCLGAALTHGMGVGGVAEMGERAADLSRHHIVGTLRGQDLLFVVAGLGGGTGSGAAPLVARIGRDLGALVVGIVTLPFSFEGVRRRGTAVAALAAMAGACDAVITLPNDRLLAVAQVGHSVEDSFALVDDAVGQAIAGISEIATRPGLINVDFADVRAVLRGAGPTLMACGTGTGEDRARHAAEEALRGGWLGADVRGARRALVNIIASPDAALAEISDVMERIDAALDHAAESVFGAVIDPALHDTVRVTLIAADIPPLG